MNETEDENTDDISLRATNEHLEVELTEKELDRTQNVLKMLRYTLINFCGFLRYGKHKIESFFIFGFVWVMGT